VQAAAPLEAVVADQAATIEKLSAEREQYRKLYMELLERCALLERGIVAGQRRSASRGRTCSSRCRCSRCSSTRRRASKRPSPPRSHTRSVSTTEIELVPPEVQHAGLDAFVRVGEEVREVLERRPERLG